MYFASVGGETAPGGVDAEEGDLPHLPLGRPAPLLSGHGRRLAALGCRLLPDPVGALGQAEVVLVKVGDAGELVCAEGGRLGGGGELLELLRVVDVRQGGGDIRGGEEPLEWGLAHRPAGALAEEAELLQLLQSVDEPLAGAVAAVVAGRGGRLLP